MFGVMSDVPRHPLEDWAAAEGWTIVRLADAAGCSAAHLSNILAGRKEPSVGLASRLINLTGGTVPLDAFVKSERGET
jgi:transcriptional regulator with XRE-family HTH domain